MKNLKSKKWWASSGTRAIKTIAQTALSLLSTSAILADVDWKFVLSSAALAGLISLLTSLEGLPEVNE